MQCSPCTELWVTKALSVNFSVMEIYDITKLHIEFFISRSYQADVAAAYQVVTLGWRHNGRDGISNHQPHDCLPNRSFGHRSKKTSKLHLTGLCAGNPRGPVNSPHKWPVTRKMFSFDDVIMMRVCSLRKHESTCVAYVWIFTSIIKCGMKLLIQPLNLGVGLGWRCGVWVE